MAITPSDFSKIWASNADTPEYTFTEADYLKGWDFVGNLPPTRAQWNAMQKSTDEKMKYVFDNFGAPLTASTVAEMTMQNRVYVYTGSETGYTAGHWYYWDGTAWTDGGVYNSNTVQVDPTLTVSGAAADAKATGDAIALKPNSDPTLTISGAAADAKVTGEKLLYLRDSAVTVEQYMPIDIALINNEYVRQDGVVVAYKGWSRTDYIPVTAGDKVYFKNGTGSSYNIFFRSDKSVRGQFAVKAGESFVTVVTESAYMMLSAETAKMEQLQVYVTNHNYVKGAVIYDYEPSDIKTYSSEKMSTIFPVIERINLFDKATITEGVYLNINSGNTVAGNGFFASDYIDLSGLSTVKTSYAHLMCWYDAKKNFVGHPDNMNSGSADLTYTIPDNVTFLRFSAYNANLNVAQVGENITRSEYFAHKYYKQPNLLINPSQIEAGESGIVVDASGGGDYTSFSQAVYENPNTDIVIKQGTYDIVAEYVALFGQEAVDNMADSDTDIFNGFQFGVRLNKAKYTFESGARLVCDWTGHTVDGTHRFCPLAIGVDVEIIGLDLDSTATFYAIHDDYGNSNEPYTNIYRYCKVMGHNLSNANCIGGGCKKYSRHIIDNCYFDNGGLPSSTSVRYHNSKAEGAVPEIYISNSYFNGWLTPRYYGNQTTKMRVYVNNCKAQKITILQESASYTTENVELYKWNNEESVS